MDSNAMLHVPAGAGDCYWVMGIPHRILVLRDEFALVETTAPPGTGIPPHIHHEEDETFHILSGRGVATYDGQTLPMLPGETFFFPRGIPHSFACAGDEPLVFHVIITPGRFAQMFCEAGLKMEENFVAPPLGPPDMKVLGPLLEKYNVEFVR
jgi:quercetin dioxygenase-like cupin family protein